MVSFTVVILNAALAVFSDKGLCDRALNLNFCFRVRVVAILSEIGVKMSEI